MRTNMKEKCVQSPEFTFEQETSPDRPNTIPALQINK